MAVDGMTNKEDSIDFESLVVPHLDEAYRLARWLMHGTSEAEDVVQDAMLRAFTYFETFRGTNAKPWILKIVRNTAYTALREREDAKATLPLVTDDGDQWCFPTIADPAASPEALLAKAQDHELLETLLAELPIILRECIILHELNGLSYKEIAEITDLPIGTVMSRLWRARRALVKLAAGSDR
jgi:RNA polymerase sigma-70 factor (ECF subfamily)